MDRWLDVAETALRAIQPGLPHLDRSRCLPARHLGVACSLCRDVCPRSALGNEAIPKPDSSACDGCAACAAACPTSALTSPPLEAAFTAWLSTIGPGSVGVEIRCGVARANDTPAAADTIPLTLPCLGTLRAADIVAIRARGASELAFVSADCSVCDRASAGRAFEGTLGMASGALVAIQAPTSITRGVAPARNDVPRTSTMPERRMSRRGLFTLWQSTARDAATGIARENESSAGFVGRSSLTPAWRQRLEMDVRALAAESAAPTELPVGLGAAVPFVAGTCDGCGLCALVCPFGALVVDQTRVGCRVGACTACGLCVAACPTGGLALRPLGIAEVRAAAAAEVAEADRWEQTPATSAASLDRRATLTDARIRDSARKSVTRSPTG